MDVSTKVKVDRPVVYRKVKVPLSDNQNGPNARKGFTTNIHTHLDMCTYALHSVVATWTRAPWNDSMHWVNTELMFSKHSY